MNYYTFHIGDYIKNTHYLDEFEDLSYRRLLDLYYQKEAALVGGIEKIARMIRMSQHIDAVKAVLSEFFSFDEEGQCWRNSRCDAELARIYEKSEKARASANARHSKAKSQKSVVNQKPVSDFCERNANAMLPNTQYPIQEREISAHAHFSENQPNPAPVPDSMPTDTHAAEHHPDGLSAKQVLSYLHSQGITEQQSGYVTDHADLIAACAIGVSPNVLTYAWAVTCAKGKQHNPNYFFAVLLGQVREAAVKTNQPEVHAPELPKSEKPISKGRKVQDAQEIFDAGVAVLEAAGVTDTQVINDYMAIRASKNAGLLTKSAVDYWTEEGKSCGMSLVDVLKWCAKRSYPNFVLEWAKPDASKRDASGLTEAQKMAICKQREQALAEDKKVAQSTVSEPKKSRKPPFSLAETLKKAQIANAAKEVSRAIH